jgi:cellulose biosynthesis protein BcsQ
MNKNYCVVQTKGGAGKTTISVNVLALMFKNDDIKVNIFELDNNNTSKLANSKLNFQSLKVDKSDEAINKVYFDIVSNSKEVNIIDCGGGDDTVKVLEYIQKIDMQDIVYIIPLNDDIEQFDNVVQTIKLIKSTNKKAIIHLFFNRCNNLNEQDVKKQFVGFFGSDIYNINSKIELIQNEISSFVFIPNTPLFGILKSYGISLYDSYNSSKDLVDNISTYRQNWAKEGKKVFSKNMARFTFAKDILELIDDLKIINKIKG